MKKIFGVTLIILSAAPSFAGDISHVTIRNQKFEIVKNMDGKTSLKQFEDIWKTKVKLKSSVAPQWFFKIDIEGKGHGDRWLYDARGFVKVLSKAKVPTYKIPVPDSFNQLIGIHNQAARPDR